MIHRMSLDVETPKHIFANNARGNSSTCPEHVGLVAVVSNLSTLPEP